ncbi:PKD domain-containing protein [Spirosoma oryzae]|uniref:PKD domain-containing protein n=1 Tax=Spirosoma oryzae TaxID=1469603 RepID=A0A2T0RQP2_9BACT|nr:putative Ig domain-containing protein [Spirosoma oryzae]PRY23488.1 PKD domain-containing protein [Spirosoma oryzae]
MKQFNRLGLLASLVLLIHSAWAQVTMPLNRIVFQRNQANQATIPVQGNCPAGSLLIQAKATALQGGTSTDWTTISSNPSTVFSGSLNLRGGWYRLEVRSLAGGSQTGYWTVDRVGVGEVFVVAGQSNNLGSIQANQLAAQDDRVSVLNYWNNEEIDEQNLPKSFSQAGNGTTCGPRNPLYIWGGLGDRLAARLNVPVLFLGAAHAGTPSYAWRDAANGQENVRDMHKNAPYRALGVDLIYYIKRTGVRSVLWHQGESDNMYQTQQGYVDNMKTVIGKARTQSGLGNMSWTIARASYFPFYAGHETDAGVIAGQNQTIGEVSNCFAGPATDDYIGSEYRADQLHFREARYSWLADLWNGSLSDSFFSNCEPSLPASVPAITTGYILPFAVNGGDNINVPFMATAPVNGDNTYQVELLDESGNSQGVIGSGSGTLITVQLPVWANGRLRVRVNSTSPARTGEASEVFTATRTGDKPTAKPPVLTSAYNALSFQVGQAIANTPVPGNFTDPTGLAITYSWSGLPGGISGNGLTVSGTPTTAGTFTAQLTATNTAGLSASASIPVTITPATSTTTPVTGTYGSPLGFLDGANCGSVFGWAADQASPSASVNVDVFLNNVKVVTAVAGETRNDVANAIGGTSARGYSINLPASVQTGGTYTLVVKLAGSNFSLTGSPKVVTGCPNLSGTSVNHAPVLSVVPASQQIDAGATLSVILPGNTFTDPDNDALTYRWSDLPDGITGNGLTLSGVVTTAGIYTLQLSATDSTGLSISTSLKLTVNADTEPVPIKTTAYGSPAGFLDWANCTNVGGWAVDFTRPGSSVDVVLFINGQQATTMTANEQRLDVEHALGVSAQKGYTFTVPASMRTGGSYSYDVKLAGSNFSLTGSRTVNGCPSGGRLGAVRSESATAATASAWMIYPNPASSLGTLTVDYPNSVEDKLLTAGLVSMQGTRQELTIESFGDGRMQLHLPQLKEGIYVLMLVCEGKLLKAEKVLIVSPR